MIWLFHRNIYQSSVLHCSYESRRPICLSTEVSTWFRSSSETLWIFWSLSKKSWSRWVILKPLEHLMLLKFSVGSQKIRAITLPWNLRMGLSKIGVPPRLVSFNLGLRIMFHFHDDGRKGIRNEKSGEPCFGRIFFSPQEALSLSVFTTLLSWVWSTIDIKM